MPPFGCRRLDERYAAYLQETQRLQRQNALTADCDIEDYIDEDTIYATVNKPFCDQLGGIMSGLGILFTFIGLVYGLRNFDASSVDMMQTSTQALMAGIKIAFLTSIFGLIYSLLFNLVYKNLLRNGIQAVRDFQDAYTERVRPSNEHAAENAMLRMQSEQNDALERFGTSVGDQISESIITLMQPMIQQLQDSINNYVTVSIEDQRAGMDKVVRYFLENMNTAMGSIFVQLKARTEDLTRWEKDTIDSFRTMSESIGKTARDLAQTQTYCQDMIRTMAAYTDTIQSLTTAQTTVVQGMESFMDDYRRHHETEDALVRSMSSAAQTAAASMDKSLVVAQSIQRMADQMENAQRTSSQQTAEAGRQMADAARSVQEMAGTVTTDINAAAARLERAAGDLDGVMSRSISDSLAQMDDSLARLNDSLNHTASIVTNVAQALRAMPKTVSSLDGDIKASAKTIDTELKLLLKAVSDTQRSLSRFNADLDRRIDR
ncbi:MAG: MotA/TolQ/ExbB proton channel family protein [Oscillospiraceae bacterium]|nr:MotA/TolQ/ExbB proton channel family protein [Oscillospiraceae bacterium]